MDSGSCGEACCTASGIEGLARDHAGDVDGPGSEISITNGDRVGRIDVNGHR